MATIGTLHGTDNAMPCLWPLRFPRLTKRKLCLRFETRSRLSAQAYKSSLVPPGVALDPLPLLRANFNSFANRRIVDGCEIKMLRDLVRLLSLFARLVGRFGVRNCGIRILGTIWIAVLINATSATSTADEGEGPERKALFGELRSLA